MDNARRKTHILLRYRGNPISLTEEESGRLRANPGKGCLVPADWARLEPALGQYDEIAFTALREILMRLGALGLDPVLVLCGTEPGWFTARGGWENTDNIRCFLRYAGKAARCTGHLCSRFITFENANRIGWNGHSHLKGSLRMSCIANAHIRAYRLIHDVRKDRGFTDTAVGFSMEMLPPRSLRRGFLPLVPESLPAYQTFPLRAMASGEFFPPLRNVLRVQPGHWCDFIGLRIPAHSRRMAIAKGLTRTAAIPAEDIRQCCSDSALAAGCECFLMED